MADLTEQARTLVQRLRTPRVTHHQVSRDWEEYATAAITHPVETIKLEAADVIERLLSTDGVDPSAAAQPKGGA